MRYMLVAGFVIVSSSWYPPMRARPLAPVSGQAVSASEAAQSERRYQIRVLEGILVNSVQHAAESMVRRIQTLTPAMVGPMTDIARARGFILPDYGVFFDVEVPGLPLSLVYSMRVMERNFDVGASLEAMRRVVASIPDAAARRDAEQALRRIELEFGASAAPSRAADTVEAATLLPAAPAPVPAPPAERIADPNETYTTEVKNALVDAMLDYGNGVGVASGEWLTIAARDSHGPSYPGEPYDAITIVLRIKGSDLADFRADRITRDEARKRVEVREF